MPTPPGSGKPADVLSDAESDGYRDGLAWKTCRSPKLRGIRVSAGEVLGGEGCHCDAVVCAREDAVISFEVEVVEVDTAFLGAGEDGDDVAYLEPLVYRKKYVLLEIRRPSSIGLETRLAHPSSVEANDGTWPRPLSEKPINTWRMMGAQLSSQTLA